MENYEVINYLIQKNNYKSYLEIGTWIGINFEKINIENKECCDIDGSLYSMTYAMSSDEMFAKMPIDKKYDIIFIDAMHSEEYLDRDIINSLKHLNPNGLILCHDVLPPDNYSTSELYNGNLWTGTCWKSICKLQDQNIEFHTLNQKNLGLTIIKAHNNPYSLHYPYNKCTLDFEYVFKNGFKINEDDEKYNPCTEQGKYILHYITLEEFFNIY